MQPCLLLHSQFLISSKEHSVLRGLIMHVQSLVEHHSFSTRSRYLDQGYDYFPQSTHPARITNTENLQNFSLFDLFIPQSLKGAWGQKRVI